MKKGIISLAVVMVLAMTVALFTPAFAATAEPVVLDWTKADACPATPQKPGLCWSGLTRGASAFDAAEGAWKIEITKEVAAWTGVFMEAKPQDCYNQRIDLGTYKYAKVAYKTAGFNEAGNDVCFRRLGSVWGPDIVLPYSNDSYNELVLDLTEYNTEPDKTSLLETVTFTFNTYKADQSAAEVCPVGATLWVKYIAFFETKAEADAFDITTYVPPVIEEPEVSEPEASAPESSAPESSAPESSAPESSKPESSKPESSKPSADTGHGTVISGAVILCAAAAAVVLASKKR